VVLYNYDIAALKVRIVWVRGWLLFSHCACVWMCESLESESEWVHAEWVEWLPASEHALCASEYVAVWVVGRVLFVHHCGLWWKLSSVYWGY
jgi:hypothetical protein